jgi:flagellar assembly protein FliH
MSNLWPERLLDAAQRADLWRKDAHRRAGTDQDAYARGLAEGRQIVEAEFAAEREALMQLACAIEELKPPASGSLATLMVTAVMRLVADVAGRASVDADLLAERALALAELAGAETEAILVANPADCELLDTSRLTNRLVADAGVPRGSVQLRVGDAMAEDGVNAALVRLHGEFERMGLVQ